ncbi:MAG: hypothetical protein HOG03_09640 [Desulfobacula sp.]|mgnify:CR=1 FL=1|jgi:hypothetical protein|uniref:hypothetical protein n=1 Tax=Desulfobacula sp. TaxID=2593537 RepID=UPI001D608FEE|nr:hypothetical protein [Desulfobacula sp.]MBT3485501.1 hypothetical protein [Desulfobacula sp.]MBT3804849.1 hypothetical protein [Desulfobacula sp.]MBT4027447.1 hypothetical protein [Desulfobacula sp.]MBT4201247.1 hypothetical protein [Desulfobacula sp.]
MAIFDKTGFIRKQEVALAKKLLVWKYEKSGTILPDEKILSTHAEKIVNGAHIIAQESGNNILDIIKENVKNIKNLMK